MCRAEETYYTPNLNDSDNSNNNNNNDNNNNKNYVTYIEHFPFLKNSERASL